ncbi:hypothetical protein [Microlunatus soli]|uniref:Uncharacterized protein n=1 Tax=Microlunatus soli TaxID=630515 RepID=A0A1H2ANK5_9ACTN|nr:hypothetical protein [Microlunatus soli]SDT47444.1 hypothetical protein SAMN04489812_6087 [Microlunatus soli]
MVSADDLLAPMARRARRLPGFPMLRRVVLPRVRQNTTFRAIARKLWASDVLPDGRGADLTAGNLLAGTGLEALPVAVFDLSGVPAESIQQVVDSIAELQLLTAGFRPVLVLPTPDFGCARCYGYPAELMPTAESADRVRFWQHVRRAYGTSVLYEVGPAGLSATQKSFLSVAPAPVAS